jgi:hypothetical protein
VCHVKVNESIFNVEVSTFNQLPEVHVMTVLEILDSPTGKLMLLQCAIEEIQECMEPLGQNRPFISALFDAITNAGVLTEERLNKRWAIVNEKVEGHEPPFDRPFFVADPNDPHRWEKMEVCSVEAFEQADEVMSA